VRFVSALRASQFEEMLQQLPPAKPDTSMELSPAKRALLARRLQERSFK
jgi:hypothetical protein